MKDYSLYNKVNSILSANTIKEAEDIMLGRDGIHINSIDYYQELIASFNMKKETIIPKINNKIVFNIDSNKQEIWNIVFLGKILQEGAINFNEEEFNEALKDVMLLNIPNKTIDENVLEELRKSIRIIQKFKDSTMHNNDGESLKFKDGEECELIINNKEGSFSLEVNLPIRYIEGFNKGNIIPLEKDKNVERKTNDIVYPLLEALDYDPKKVLDFFYRVDPEILSLLLNKLDNDIKKLYQINHCFLIEFDENRKENIRKIIRMLDFDNLTKISSLQCFSNEYYSLIEKYGTRVLDLPKEHTHDLKTTIQLLDKYGLDFVLNLPADAFLNIDITVKLLDDNKDKHNEVKNIDFITEDEIKKIKEIISKIEQDYKEKYKLSNEIMSLKDCMAFYYDGEKEEPLNDYRNYIDHIVKDKYIFYYNLNRLLKKYDISLLKKLPSKDAFFNYESTVKFLDKYGDDVQYLPKEVFGEYCDFNFFESLVDNYNIDYKKIKLVDFFDSYAGRKLYADVIDESNIKEMLYNFNGKTAQFKRSNLEKILNKVDNDYSRLDEFPAALFDCDIQIFDELYKNYESIILKSIFGINNPKVISLLVYMRSVLDKYNSKLLNKDEEFIISLSGINNNILKDNNEYLDLLNSEIKKCDNRFKQIVNNYYLKSDEDKIKYVNRVNESSYVNYQNSIKNKFGKKINDELIRHLRNSISHFRFKVVSDNIIKLYDENDVGDVVYEKEFNIYNLFEFIHDVEKCLNKDLEDKDLIEICSNMGIDLANKVMVSELLHIMSINKEMKSLENEKSVKL